MKWCRDINGTYILRNSFHSPGHIVASVWYKGKHRKASLKHLPISTRGNAFYFSELNLFPTLAKLIEFYAHNDVPSAKNLVGLRLSNPITMTSTLERGSNGPRKSWADQTSSQETDDNTTSGMGRSHQLERYTSSGVSRYESFQQKRTVPEIIIDDLDLPNSYYKNPNDLASKHHPEGTKLTPPRRSRRSIPLPPPDDPEDSLENENSSGSSPDYCQVSGECGNDVFVSDSYQEPRFLFPSKPSGNLGHRLSDCSTSSTTSQDSAYVSEPDVPQIPKRVKTKKRFGFLRLGKNRSKSLADLPRRPLHS
jgi:hypothetical protein